MSHPKSTVPDIDSLLYKFTELLTGDANEERVELVKTWALYSHLLKVMPPVVQHWTSEHPQEKQEMRKIFEQIQEWNQENKGKIREQQNKFNTLQKNEGTGG
ncbi:DUF2573 family protein [Aneurinibacillus terranovensis]|uniref:DUF2573 family protein n=1 Tax=Aneurinibacillus terranovensis TaxID=278991 RepID=UPI0004152DB6|nr:DUF2573 family protein [Aneurinibacillus terranovensis]